MLFIEILLFSLFGFSLGIFTGLAPGIHVNTISLILLPFASVFNPLFIAVAIISMSISHTFFDFVPSILLGAPEPETALSILPGHHLLMEGRGIEAIYLTVVGGIGAIFFTLFLLPAFIFLIPVLYESSKFYVGWVLVGIAIFMIAIEKKMKKVLQACLVFMLSGILGLIIFNNHILSTNALFFPAFAGLFGISTLLLSLKSETRIPLQSEDVGRVPVGVGLSGIIKGIVSGSVMAVLPALGAAQATVLTQEMTRKRDEREFLVSIGAINTIVALFSLLSLYTISKPRSGAAVAVNMLVPFFGYNEMLLLVAVSMFSAGISALLLLVTMKRIVAALQKVNYRKLTLYVIAALVVLTVFLTGIYGFLVLCVSVSIGLLAPLFGIKRSTAMGVLMLPLIFFYMGI